MRGAVGGAPIRHDPTREVERALKLAEHFVVLAAVHAVDLVVSTHHAADSYEVERES